MYKIQTEQLVLENYLWGISLEKTNYPCLSSLYYFLLIVYTFETSPVNFSVSTGIVIIQIMLK